METNKKSVLPMWFTTFQTLTGTVVMKVMEKIETSDLLRTELRVEALLCVLFSVTLRFI